MKYLSDFERCGFRRSDIIPFLESQGIDIAGTLEMIRAEGAKARPVVDSKSNINDDWKEHAARRPRMSVAQWCRVMCGRDPDIEDINESESPDWTRWYNTITEATSILN